MTGRFGIRERYPNSKLANCAPTYGFVGRSVFRGYSRLRE
jgi:hypothetical protein